nr:hypothetical protein CFP56_30581 [Quercus suber]
MPPKKKARKIRHVDEVTAPEHGHRQRQECERPVTPDGGEIDEVVVAGRIYARIARAVQGDERRREDFLFGEFRKQNPPTFDGGPDPMAAENWLLKMEKLLRALESFGVDTFTEAVKRATSLDEDFKYNPSSKESEKKQGPFNSQHVRVKDIRKDSLKTQVIEDNPLVIARMPILSMVIRSLALVVANFMMDKIVMGSRFVLFVSNPDTLLEIAQVLRARVPLPHLKLQRVLANLLGAWRIRILRLRE